MLTNLRLISVQEYHQMAETGIFHPEERLELIAEKSLECQQKELLTNQQLPAQKDYYANA